MSTVNKKTLFNSVLQVEKLTKLGATLPVTLSLVLLNWVILISTRITKTNAEDIFGYNLTAPFNPLHMFSSAFSTKSFASATISTILILACGLSFEKIIGSLRYLVLVFATHVSVLITGKIIADFLVSIGGVFATAALDDVILTPASWCAAVGWLGSRRLNTLWRRRTRLAILVLTITMFLYSATVVDFGRIATVLGAAILVMRSDNDHITLFRVSQNEVRWLTGLSFMALNLGPSLAAANPSARAPLSEVTVLGWPSPEFFVEYYGITPIIYNQLPLVLCFIIAVGLTRGRRIAWVLAILTMISTIVAQAWESLQFVVETPIALLAASTTPWIVGLLAMLVLPAYFQGKSPRRPFLRAFGRISVAAGLSISVWLVIVFFAHTLYALPDAEKSSAVVEQNVFTLLQHALLGAWHIFLPPVISRLVSPALFPISQLGFSLQQVPGIFFWILACVILTRLIFGTPRPYRINENADYMRDILRGGTGHHISWMTTWGNLNVFKHPFGYVAYHLHTTTAVALSEPVLRGPHEHAKLRAIAVDFARYCEAEGLTLAWYCVSPEFHALLGDDMQSVKVADESIVKTEIRSFVGKKFNDVRTARNNAKKLGIETVWSSWEDLNTHTKHEILALSEEWVQQKTLPEMGFTLGSVDELRDSEVKLMVALDSNGYVHGVTSWLPVYQDGLVAGYVLDFMRRDRNGFKGVVELMIAAMLDTAAEMDMEWISLSGAPLVNLAAEEETDKQLDRVLDNLSSLLEPAYGFKSLAAFKRKFRPEREPWLLLYRSPLHLPQIGVALMNAYLPQQPLVKLYLKLLRTRAIHKSKRADKQQ